MSSFVVSARKHRPVSFPQVFGQEHITTTLEHAIKEQRIAQAMLFCGPRGVGKTTCARIFAHQINGFEGRDPTKGAQALNIFELDAASNNSVEDIRSLVEQVRFPPQGGTHKVYIIDEVHMLSQQAFNAFLKTLEEPPSYAVFILATTEKQKVLPTVLSRCQIFHFKRISVPDIVDCLKKVCEIEKLEAEEEGLYQIARKSDGSLRDAFSLFDMLITFCEGKKLTHTSLQEHLDLLDTSYFFEIITWLRDGNLANALLALDTALQSGVDMHQLLLAWSEVMRDLLLAKDSKTKPLVMLSASQTEVYQQEAAHFSSDFLLEVLDVLNTGEQQYKQSQYPRLHMELLLTKISQINQKTTESPPLQEKNTIISGDSPQSASPSIESPNPSGKVAAPSKTEDSNVQKKEQIPPKSPIKSNQQPYTDQEKLEVLAKKNPDLKNIQQRFALEGEL